MIPKPPRRVHVDVPAASGETRRMAVHDWGEITNPRVLVCGHGLARNGRDFDVIAHALSDHYRVLCPDVIGRGESDWFATTAEYAIPNYVAAMQAMFAALAIREYDWIGTSMGGLIGMVLAVSPNVANTLSANSGMRRFVINDIGPEIAPEAIARIAANFSTRAPTFPDYRRLFAAAHPAIATFGPLTEEQQHHLVATSCRKRDDGLWEFKIDPKIGEAFVAGANAPAVDLWPFWASIQMQCLILQGEHSDLLYLSTVNKMLSIAKQSRVISVKATGHAPMLMDETTIAQVREFLLAP